VGREDETRREEPPVTFEDVWPDDSQIAIVETNPKVKARPYGFRKLDLGLARLARAYGC
jgi:hypothetical protein